MTEIEFDEAFDNGELEEEYADFIMENPGRGRTICNGDTLLEAMENGYLYEDFKASFVK